MLQLHTFGGLGLEDSGRPIAGAGAQRSRLVLLSVLAASGNRGISRDSLLALFWPESDTESARGALKQALYALRRDLGEAELTSGVTDLKLNRSVIDSDVGTFCEAFEKGDFERAAGLYRGGFLEGIHLPSAEFEQWLSQQRSHLTELYRQALENLARGAESRGDYSAAVRWWKALAAADPLSAAVARSLMQSLVKLGDSPAALAHGRAYEQMVRAELDSAPDPSVLELVEAIRRGSALPKVNGRGQPIPAPEATPQPVPLEPAISLALAPPSATETQSPSYSRRASRQRLLWIGIGCALTAIIIGTMSLQGGSPSLDPNGVVLTGLGGSEPRTALDSLVMVNLAAGVVGRDSTLTVSLGQLTLASVAGSTTFAPRRQVRARYQVAMRSAVKGDSLLLDAEVTDATTGMLLGQIEPVQVPDRERDVGIRLLRDRIAIALESQRNPVFTSWGHLAAIPRNWESFEQLELGIKALTGPEAGAPHRHFRAAAKLDSTSATPLVWDAFDSADVDSITAELERSSRRMGSWDRALLAILKARNRGDKAGAHAAGHQLLDLVGTRSEWAHVVAWDLVGLSRYREALELLKRVPDWRWANGYGAVVVARDLALHMLGDYEGELKAARAELARNPDDQFNIQMEVKALGALGRVRELLEACERAYTLHGDNPWQPWEQGIVELQGHGYPDAARAVAERFIQALAKAAPRTSEEQTLDQAAIWSDAGDWSRVEQVLRPLPPKHPDYLAYLWSLAKVQAWRGDRSGLAETQRRIEEAGRGIVSDKCIVEQHAGRAWNEAGVAALLGERDRAVDLLAKRLREGCTGRYGLHWMTEFTSLRDYPPFVDLYKPLDDPAHLREVLGHENRP